MLQVIVSVKDTAAQAFGRPVFVPAVPVAVRSFRDEVKSKKSDQDLDKYPDDFELYEIGTFDDATGIVQVLDAPRMVARAKDLKESV